MGPFEHGVGRNTHTRQSSALPVGHLCRHGIVYCVYVEVPRLKPTCLMARKKLHLRDAVCCISICFINSCFKRLTLQMTTVVRLIELASH